MANTTPLANTGLELEGLSVEGQFVDIHTLPINALSVSPTQRFLASADDGGLLVVCETLTWTIIRVYKHIHCIRAIAWYPKEEAALVVGSGNGEMNKLRINLTGLKPDLVALETIPGFIHAMTFNKDGSQLAVNYGNRVGIMTLSNFDDAWGTAFMLPTPVEGQPDQQDYPIIRGLHYLDDRTLLVCYFLYFGFIAFSTKDAGNELWRIPLRLHTTCGATSLSPSGTLLVVTNLHDGLDWYGLVLRRWVKTSFLDMGTIQCIFQPVFITDDTVASAHVNGRMAFAKYNENLSPEPRVFWATRSLAELQMVTAAKFRDKLWICASSLSTGDEKKSKILVMTLPIPTKNEVKVPPRAFKPTQGSLRLRYALPRLALLAVSVYTAILWEGHVILPNAVYRLAISGRERPQASSSLGEGVVSPVDVTSTTAVFPIQLGGVGPLGVSTDVQPKNLMSNIFDTPGRGIAFPPPVEVLSPERTTSYVPVTMVVPNELRTTLTEGIMKTQILTETVYHTETILSVDTITKVVVATRTVTQTITATVISHVDGSRLLAGDETRTQWEWPYGVLAALLSALLSYFAQRMGLIAHFTLRMGLPTLLAQRMGLLTHFTSRMSLSALLARGMVLLIQFASRMGLVAEAGDIGGKAEEGPEALHDGGRRKASMQTEDEEMSRRGVATEPQTSEVPRKTEVEEPEIPWGGGLECISEEGLTDLEEEEDRMGETGSVPVTKDAGSSVPLAEDIEMGGDPGDEQDIDEVF